MKAAMTSGADTRGVAFDGKSIRRRLSRSIAFALSAFALGASSFVGFRGVCAADGSVLWGSANERTTYRDPYCPATMEPNVPLVSPRDDGKNARTGGESGGGSDSAATSGGADPWAKLRETGTCVAPDGTPCSYRYVEGVRKRRVVETRTVEETPPGGLFPIATTKKFVRWVDEPVLIKVLTPLSGASASPAPCGKVGASSASASNGTAAVSSNLNAGSDSAQVSNAPSTPLAGPVVVSQNPGASRFTSPYGTVVTANVFERGTSANARGSASERR